MYTQIRDTLLSITKSGHLGVHPQSHVQSHNHISILLLTHTELVNMKSDFLFFFTVKSITDVCFVLFFRIAPLFPTPSLLFFH